jgi:hypothetical protein
LTLCHLCLNRAGPPTALCLEAGSISLGHIYEMGFLRTTSCASRFKGTCGMQSQGQGMPAAEGGLGAVLEGRERLGVW